MAFIEKHGLKGKTFGVFSKCDQVTDPAGPAPAPHTWPPAGAALLTRFEETAERRFRVYTEAPDFRPRPST